MNKIEEFISIPRFIEIYIDKKENGLETLTHDFCKIMTELNYTVSPNNSNSNIYQFDSENNYSIKRFLDFYFDKSKLNLKLMCKYEDELNISKSIANELFVINSNNKLIHLYIDSFENGIVKMISV